MDGRHGIGFVVKTEAKTPYQSIVNMNIAYGNISRFLISAYSIYQAN
jgi:hypothetical protein